MEGIEQCHHLIQKVADYLNNDDLPKYLAEIEQNQTIISSFEEKVRDVQHFKTKSFSNIFEFSFYRLLLYSLVRAKRPRIVVETGVMHGLASSFILEGVKQNKFGRLISIDYPSYFETGPSNKDGFKETLPPDKESGWIVDKSNRPFWDLRLGASREILGALLKSDLPIDLFFHDSDHTYENMTFEMEYAWENLSSDGLLIVDNIDCNKSFSDFCKKVGKKFLELPSPNNQYSEVLRLGVISK